ncbi:hypothetical protein [Sphingomonas soli]|uniref:hypothetical protein n=1 Tax=Sphingomonas soli TaxID=266127 RepID=UPI000834F337|nr:hypothetical protein [Sphingomonas soli]
MTQDRSIRVAAMAAVLGLSAITAMPAEAVPQRAKKTAVRGPVAKLSDYSWIDRADALWEAIGDAPPDYSFPYEGLEPWAWQTADGHQIMVEDAGEQGGIRSYYFAPGAQSPFLVVEPGASFGFTGTKLAMLYGPDGGVVPRAQWGKRPARGQILFARARLIKRAMERERYGIDPYLWVEMSGPILSFLGQWDLGHARHSAWRVYRNSAEGKDRRRRLENERVRRIGEARDFDRWRRDDLRGAPPAGVAPRRPGAPGYRPQPRPNAGTPPPHPRGEQPPRRPDRAPGAFDPALMEPMVPGGRPAAPARDDRPGRPALNDRRPAPPAANVPPARPSVPQARPARPPRPASGVETPPPPPVQPSAPATMPAPPRPDRSENRPPRVQPVAPTPQPVVRPTPAPPAPPVVERPYRPDRGEGRPPRLQPVSPAPQPVQIRPTPVAPPAPQPVQVRPAPVAPPAPAVQPRPAPPERRPAKLDWTPAPSPQIDRPAAPLRNSDFTAPEPPRRGPPPGKVSDQAPE